VTLFRRSKLLPPLVGLLALGGGGVLYAQLEGADRGVAPVDSASTLEVTGIEVDVTGKSAAEARLAGWKQAQALGWKALWAKTTGRPRSEAPGLPDSVLNGIVSSIVIEDEQIGPTRYIARLGILFDRARTGQMLGVGGQMRRSAPMLVIPVMQTGSSQYSFEYRNEWQRAWARYRTGGSPVDYVRPAGSGIDPLLLNAAQTGRPGRGWWRLLLDQYGAADVVMPHVHLQRSYPGGPASATFTARFGPDGRVIERFTLRVASSAGIPKLLNAGVERLDAAYSRALAAGYLAPDPSLAIQEPAIAQLLETMEPVEASTAEIPVQTGGAVASFTIQVDTPDAGSVNAAELSVSRIRGVTSALTTSLALGGTSVMKVTFAGDGAGFAAALQAQGWTVQGLGTNLRISRAATPPPDGP